MQLWCWHSYSDGFYSTGPIIYIRNEIHSILWTLTPEENRLLSGTLHIPARKPKRSQRSSGSGENWEQCGWKMARETSLSKNCPRKSSFINWISLFPEEKPLQLYLSQELQSLHMPPRLCTHLVTTWYTPNNPMSEEGQVLSSPLQREEIPRG